MPIDPLAALIAAAEKYFRLEPGMLLSYDRSTPLVQFRQLTQRVAFERGYHVAEIGRAFGRNWATVSHACQLAAQQLNSERPWWLYTKAGLIDAWEEELGVD